MYLPFLVIWCIFSVVTIFIFFTHKERSAGLMDMIVFALLGPLGVLLSIFFLVKNRKTKIITAIIAGLLVLFFFLPFTRDEIHWILISQSEQPESYKRYIDSRPLGRHFDEAATKYQRLMELPTWKKAVAKGTIKSYQDYLDAYPNGRYRKKALSIQAALRQDDRPFIDAEKKNTPTAYKTFLREFPGHKNEKDVQNILADISGRDIFNLMTKKRIEVIARGAGMKSVNLIITKKIFHPVMVIIPVGVYFRSTNSPCPNMVATEKTSVLLDDNKSKEVWVEALATNLLGESPDRLHVFTLHRQPLQKDLIKLLPILEKKKVDYKVLQAAVWIASANATYARLGQLVERSISVSIGGRRVIHEMEAASALKLCDEAGIDISRKAIWRHRERIINKLEEGDLKQWLQSYESN